MKRNGLVIAFRMIRRKVYRAIRYFVGMVFCLFIRKVHGTEYLPKRGPCLITPNHSSYLDSIILSSLYKKKYLVILINKDVLITPVIRWFAHLNIMIPIDPKKPGSFYFKEIERHLNSGAIVIIYPEGTRSRSGRVTTPKVGFLKLALDNQVPIVPLGIKGTYEILPPRGRMVGFRRCELFVNEPISLKREHPLCQDLCDLEKAREVKDLSKKAMKELSYRIMETVVSSANLQWEEKTKIDREESRVCFSSSRGDE